MKKLNLFIIFAMAILAGCATLSVLSCSEDEYDDFEDDEVYTLSKPKKVKSVETCYSIWGDPQDGHVLKQNEKTFTDVYYDVLPTGADVLYNYTVNYTGKIIGYVDSTTNITHYSGGILSWPDVDDDKFSVQITGMTSNSISFKTAFYGQCGAYYESGHCLFL